VGRHEPGSGVLGPRPSCRTRRWQRALTSRCGAASSVRIIVPRRSNHLTADLAGASYLRAIAQEGGNIHCLANQMLHTKLVLFDTDRVGATAAQTWTCGSLFPRLRARPRHDRCGLRPRARTVVLGAVRRLRAPGAAGSRAGHLRARGEADRPRSSERPVPARSTTPRAAARPREPQGERGARRIRRAPPRTGPGATAQPLSWDAARRAGRGSQRATRSASDRCCVGLRALGIRGSLRFGFRRKSPPAHPPQPEKLPARSNAPNRAVRLSGAPSGQVEQSEGPAMTSRPGIPHWATGPSSMPSADVRGTTSPSATTRAARSGRMSRPMTREQTAPALTAHLCGEGGNRTRSRCPNSRRASAAGSLPFRASVALALRGLPQRRARMCPCRDEQVGRSLHGHMLRAPGKTGSSSGARRRRCALEHVSRAYSTLIAGADCCRRPDEL
jgi:hypothetical protein